MTKEEIIINEVQECIKAYKKRPMYSIDGVDCIVLDNDDINHISHKCAFWILSKEQDTLEAFVEWLKNQNCIIFQCDSAGTMKCDFALEKFLEEKK